MPSSSAASMSAPMSATCPRMCESISTRASLDRALRTRSSMSMTRSSVISTSTAAPPAAAMAPGTGDSVKPLVSTGSPGERPKARSAVCSA